MRLETEMNLDDFRAYILAQREEQAKANAQAMREIANAKNNNQKPL